ncbi:MAG: AAA family ATPase [Nakamurella sp.]
MHPDRDDDRHTELLVEREEQLAVVRESLAAAVRGAGGLLLVTGEAGTGKSALVRAALRSAAADGMTVFTGSGSIVGIGVFAQAWRELIPGSGDDRPLSPTAMVAAMAGMVAECPAVLWLDDLQDADEVSIDRVVTVADWARRHRLAVIAAHRSEESVRTPALRRLRATARRQGELRQVSVGPLTPAGTRSLLTAAVGPVSEPVAEAVHRCADGIPFHVRELAAALPLGGGTPADVDASVPDGVRDAVLVRIAGLPADCRAALDLAAVAGPSVETALIDTALIDTALTDTALIDVAPASAAPAGAERWSEHPVVHSVLDQVAGHDHRCASGTASSDRCCWPRCRRIGGATCRPGWPAR